jgi:hypothetical protein
MKKRLCSLEEMRLGKEKTFEYVHTEQDSNGSAAALDPHHTHFILVDNGKSGDKAWGDEIEFGLEMQLAYCSRDKQRGTARLRACTAARFSGAAAPMPHPERCARALPCLTRWSEQPGWITAYACQTVPLHTLQTFCRSAPSL